MMFGLIRDVGSSSRAVLKITVGIITFYEIGRLVNNNVNVERNK